MNKMEVILMGDRDREVFFQILVPKRKNELAIVRRFWGDDFKNEWPIDQKSLGSFLKHLEQQGYERIRPEDRPDLEE